MANAKKTNFYYVMVFTNHGPVFVTSVDYHTKTACWDKSEKPLELGKYSAEDLCFGLNANFNTSVVVLSKVELENQIYRYDSGEFTWAENSTN